MQCVNKKGNGEVKELYGNSVLSVQLLSINIKLLKIVYLFKKNFAFISILGFCVSEITFLNYKMVSFNRSKTKIPC